MDKKAQEERLYERLGLPIKINYEVFNRPYDVKKTTSKNISGSGICLSLPEKLTPQTRLKMNIKIPKSVSQRAEDYELGGTVIWSRYIEISGDNAPYSYYDTGIQFSEEDPIVVGRIISYFYGRKL